MKYKDGFELEEKVHNEKLTSDDDWELSKVDRLIELLSICKGLETKIDLLLSEVHEAKQSTNEIKNNLLHIVDIIDPNEFKK